MMNVINLTPGVKVRIDAPMSHVHGKTGVWRGVGRLSGHHYVDVNGRTYPLRMSNLRAMPTATEQQGAALTFVHELQDDDLLIGARRREEAVVFHRGLEAAGEGADFTWLHRAFTDEAHQRGLISSGERDLLNS